MEMTADALRAFFSGPPEEPLEPATEMADSQRRHMSRVHGERWMTWHGLCVFTGSGRFSQNIVQAAERLLGVCLLWRHLVVFQENNRVLLKEIEIQTLD